MGNEDANGSDLYLVEAYWPGVTEPALRAAVRRARSAAAVGDGGVSYVTSYLVGKDEVAFFLFRADSIPTIERLCQVAELPFDRVAGIVQIGAD